MGRFKETEELKNSLKYDETVAAETSHRTHQIKKIIEQWHIQREDNRQQEEIREELTTKQLLLN